MPIIRMNAEYKTLKPAALSRHILTLTSQLKTLALAKNRPDQKPAITPVPVAEVSK